MAAPSYTTDLTSGVLDTAESSTGWVEMTGTVTLTLGSEAFNAQGNVAGADGDYPFIQGSYSVTQDCTKNTAVGSLAHNNGSGTGGHGTDGAYFAWQNYMVASNIETYANDGFMMVVGSSQSAFDVWVVGGRDKAPYPYGGWVNHAVNTSVTPDYTAGSPTATEQYIGCAVYVSTGSSKGEVHNVDVIRYGRGNAIFEFGDLTNGYATIAGFAAQNDNSSNRWGLIQETAGGYLWKGRMQLGTSTNAVDFQDSNETIFIQWTPKVTANFNLIECTNTSSNIVMTGFQIICLDTTTASQGRFLMTDQCDVDVSGSTFVDMDTFVFDEGSTKTVDVTNCTFRRCARVTAGGADFDGSTFEESTVAADEGALFYDETVATSSTLNDLDNLTFSKGTNAHHALRFGTGVTADITLNNIEFSGWSGSSNDSNDSIFRFDATSGSINLNLIGCTVDGSPITTGTATIDDAAGITVTPVIDPVTTKFTVEDPSGTAIENARVLAETADNGGGTGFPYQDSVSIVQSAGTATVTHTAHGLASNDYVVIRGAQPDGYNKVAQITFSDANTYTYTVDSGLSSPATGSPVSSYAAIGGELTSTLGVVQSTKTWPSSQGLKGWARKSNTSSPFYKQAAINISDASGGTDATLTLLSDE